METNFLSETVYEKLPEFLLALTNPFSKREKDVVLLSSLGVLSTALPKVYGMYAGDKYSPNLYILIVAPAASGKGVMNKSKKLIETIHQNILEVSLGNIEDCNSQKKEKKDFNIKCPELEVKVIPGNVSSSKIYKHLKNATHGLLIFETEADTISIMLKQDWGNFSDILRKAFHHETISISREIENKFIEVRSPELSLVISGTPNQIKPLVQSKENGLFSRFMFYLFNDVVGWKDVSPKGTASDYNTVFSLGSEEVLNLYNKLQNNICDIEITLTDSQWERFNRDMDYLTQLFIHQNRNDTLSIVKRQGVMMFRLCMILTIIRNKDLDSFPKTIVCSEDDYSVAFEIIRVTIDHSIHVSNLLEEDKKELPIRETLLLASLGKRFTRNEALSYAEQKQIPVRTLDLILQRLIKSGVLQRIQNGIYEKKD